MGNGIERRDFLKVLGVGGAGASLTSCAPAAADKLIPYVVPSEDIVPGMSTWYRTTCRECPAGCGMDIRTREGRAIKAEGNPLSPIAHGKLCARGQASLHGLYNPDRVPQALARTGRRGGGAVDGWEKLTWDDAETRLANALAEHRGRTVFLTQNYTGTMDRLVDDFCAAFGITRVRYETFAWEPLRAANRMLFGVDAVPVHDFSQSDVTISFGADFMETWVSPIDYSVGYVQGHAYTQGRRGKLIYVGPHRSLTGMNADEWIAAKPGTEHMVALAIARLIADAGGNAGPSASITANIDPAQAAQAADVPLARLQEIAREFANNGRSLAVGPGVATHHSAATAVAAAVAVLNSVAGNFGKTVTLSQREEHTAGIASYADLQQLIARMNNGDIGALLVHGPNPLYTMPESEIVDSALAKVSLIASFSSFLDETSARAHLLLPDHHFLEAWGDYVPRTGLTGIIQPVMTPVFSTKQTGDVLLAVARRANATLPNATSTFYDYLRGNWQRTLYSASSNGATFDDWWTRALQTGIVDTTSPAATAAAATTMSTTGIAQLAFQPATIAGGRTEDDYFLVVYPSYKYWDGHLANRPWLQELPDPITKYTWASVVEVHPAVADRLGMDDAHFAKVTTERGDVTLQVFRNPNLRQDTIAIQLGQGHDGFGAYADKRGVNPVSLLRPIADSMSGALLYMQTTAKLEPTGDWERPPQAGMHADQDEREVAQWVSLDEARSADPARGALLAPVGSVAAPAADHAAEGGHGEQGGAAGGHGEEVHPNDARVTELQGSGGWAPATVDASPTGFPHPGMYYGEYSETQPRWGMAIDLDRCIGCSACMTACYAENNIGIVGPEQVKLGRLLQWIRIERYWEIEGDEVNTQFLPMLCQQCGNAPCEPVCPVYASYHTPEGLNAQVYNRCVGTRYCANNCPYKVRTLNFFNYEWPEPLNWQLNPDVTVREKGVMEKCTFCVQRIREKQNDARVAGRAVQDGEIQPACAQTCPGDAIVFGNLRDKNSRAARLADQGRGYRVFEELNTQSAITYLKRVSLSPGASASAEEH
jgi:molybdopterin-containing oxidoreductase family iron-sulfur binding subunit